MEKRIKYFIYIFFSKVIYNKTDLFFNLSQVYQEHYNNYLKVRCQYLQHLIHFLFLYVNHF